MKRPSFEAFVGLSYILLCLILPALFFFLVFAPFIR